MQYPIKGTQKSNFSAGNYSLKPTLNPSGPNRKHSSISARSVCTLQTGMLQPRLSKQATLRHSLNAFKE